MADTGRVHLDADGVPTDAHGFGWWRHSASEPRGGGGDAPAELASSTAHDLTTIPSSLVALGFEAPAWVPVVLADESLPVNAVSRTIRPRQPAG